MKVTLRRIVGYLFIVGALVMLAIAVARQWDYFRSAIAALGFVDIAVAFAFGGAAVASGALAWRSTIASTAYKMPLPPVVHAFLISQLGKYVPGSVWAVVSQVELMKRYGVSRAAGALGSTLSMVISLGVAVVVGAVGVFASGGDFATHWWLIPVAAVCFVVVCPPVVRWLMRLVSRSHGRLASFASITVRGADLAWAAAWTALGWVFWGLQLFVLMRGMGYERHSLIWFAIGAYALAWSVGRVVVVAPGGIGPREAAMVAILATVVTSSDALALAVTTRVLMSLLDVSGAAVAMATRRWFVREVAQ